MNEAGPVQIWVTAPGFPRCALDNRHHIEGMSGFLLSLHIGAGLTSKGYQVEEPLCDELGYTIQMCGALHERDVWVTVSYAGVVESDGDDAAARLGADAAYTFALTVAPTSLTPRAWFLFSREKMVADILHLRANLHDLVVATPGLTIKELDFDEPRWLSD